MDPAAATPGLCVHWDGPVLRLLLDRPEKRNAVTGPMLEALRAAVEEAEARDEVRAVLISARGEHFCSGWDLVAANEGGGGRPRAGHLERGLLRGPGPFIEALARVQVPIAVAARGSVAGFGLSLAMACDFVVASETARFSSPFVKRGFTPDTAATFHLPRLVGLARARRVLLLGQEIPGRTAEAWGLVHACVPDPELEGAAEALVAELAGGASVAIGLAKWLLNRNLSGDLGDALAAEAFAEEVSLRSRDFQEGLAAFREKRRPRYTGW
jgi:2-(1,2-epoxy-1,2-dihydrophenyl)acetyl-CoA isomerase